MSRPVHVRRPDCRGCGGGALTRFLALGDQPLANAFLRSEADFAGERRFPLDVYFCEDCALVQLVDVIDPEVLFRDYIYVSGTSRTMTEHFRSYAGAVAAELGLGPGDRVIEVASNDGSLLRHFGAEGIKMLGIEPATNVASIARAAGVPTLNEFFGPDTAASVLAGHGPAKAVMANNVLAHVDDTPGFLAGMRELLAPGGRVVVEVPWLGELVGRLEYDTIYHEHLCYFSLTALSGLFERAGLRMVRVDRVPVHGGSIRVWGASSSEAPEHDEAALRVCEDERARGLADIDSFHALARRVEENRRALVDLLRELRDAGKSLAAYGAPAKGNTLLNYCGIGTDLVPYTVDKNDMKVGLYTPGMHLPVRPVSTIVEERPDFVLVLAWNYAEEIARQEQTFLGGGGRFLVPIPDPGVLAA
ncbi:MAG: class I SAM-dependent methyltransferase [Gemmatimonadota bacterium]|nr:class I SAM-dependent methyltransferase [Gemmatimonadota bacterium]